MKILVAAILLLLVEVTCTDETLLLKLTKAITNLIDYYKNNFMYMNLDGIYGLRILEGQLKNILDTNIGSSKGLWLKEKLQNLYHTASETCNKSLRHVQASDPGYFAQLSPLIKEQDIKLQSYKIVSLSEKWGEQLLKTNGMSEAFSDRCIAQLLGTDSNKKSCSVTTDCLQAMFEIGHQEYTLLHQILYTISAQQHGCASVLEQYLKAHGFTSGLEGIQKVFCSNNLFEIVDLLRELPDQNIPDVYQDLFLEQEFVCPSLGYMQFLHKSWLEQILTWQEPSGCFTRSGKKYLPNYPAAVDEFKQNRVEYNNDYKPKNNGANPGNPMNVNYNNIPNNNNHDVVIQSNNEEPRLFYHRSNHSRHRRSDNVVAADDDDGDDNLSPDKWPNTHYQDWFLNGQGKRKLLEERKLQDGCMSHRTAVAAAALSQYLKFMLNPGPPEYQSDVSLQGSNYLLFSTWRQVLKDFHFSEGIPKDIENTDDKPSIPDKELVYQNQMNVPQPINLMSNNNQHGKNYDDQDENDPHGYYDDDKNSVMKDNSNINGKVLGNKEEFLPKVLKFKENWKKQKHYEADKDTGEYPDYVDEQSNKRPNIPHTKGNAQFDPFDKNQRMMPEKNDDFDPGYGYDDIHKHENKNYNQFKEGENSNLENIKDNMQISISHKYNNSPDNGLSLLKSYFIVMFVMLLLLIFMYRFIRKRRIIIRYR